MTVQNGFEIFIDPLALHIECFAPNFGRIGGNPFDGQIIDENFYGGSVGEHHEKGVFCIPDFENPFRLLPRPRFHIRRNLIEGIACRGAELHVKGVGNRPESVIEADSIDSAGRERHSRKIGAEIGSVALDSQDVGIPCFFAVNIIVRIAVRNKDEIFLFPDIRFKVFRKGLSFSKFKSAPVIGIGPADCLRRHI